MGKPPPPHPKKMVSDPKVKKRIVFWFFKIYYEEKHIRQSGDTSNPGTTKARPRNGLWWQNKPLFTVTNEEMRRE